MQKSKDLKVHKILFGLALVLYFAALFFLYHSQLVTYPADGRFESDTYVHVDFAKNGFYHSLTAFIYLFFMLFPGAEIMISVLLSAVTVLTVIFTAALIDEVYPGLNRALVYITSFALNLCMAFYLPFANKTHYIGYQNGNMWHNSTYIFMRLFAVLAVICFVRVFRDLQNGINAKDYVGLVLFLSLSTAFKASFLTVFAPFLLTVLIIELIRGVKFKYLFIMGCSVLLPIVIMIIESLALFDSESGIAVSPFATLSRRGDHPKLTVICSVLFLIFVLAFSLKDVFADKVYGMSILFFAVGFAEVFLLTETGTRSEDQNFMWGYSITLFFAFVFAVIRMLKSFFERKSYVALSICSAVLLWHFVSGIWYFFLLLQGFTYFV